MPPGSLRSSREPEGRAVTRQRLLNLLKVVISLGLLVFLVSRVDLRETLDRLALLRWLPFLSAVALLLGGVGVRAWRWGVLAWALEIQVSLRRLVALYFVGSFFSLVLPTGVGGDAVRIYELARTSKASSAASSVLVERFSGLLVLFLMAALALMGNYHLVSPRVRGEILAIALIGLAGAVLVLQRTWIESVGRRLRLNRLLGRSTVLRDLYASLHQYGRAALGKVTAASLVFNLMQIFANALLAQAVGIHQPLPLYFLFVPIIAVMLMLPSVGGLGLREGAYVLLFGQVGVDPPHALALALAYDAVLLLIGLIGASIYLAQSARESGRQ